MQVDIFLKRYGHKPLNFIHYNKNLFFWSGAMSFVFRCFWAAEFIKNNVFALSVLYAELQRPEMPKIVIVKYIAEYIRRLIGFNEIYFKAKTEHKNKL